MRIRRSMIGNIGIGNSSTTTLERSSDPADQETRPDPSLGFVHCRPIQTIPSYFGYFWLAPANVRRTLVCPSASVSGSPSVSKSQTLQVLDQIQDRVQV